MKRGTNGARALLRLAALSAGSIAMACSQAPDRAQKQAGAVYGCVPGTQLSCMCPDGVTQGIQICDGYGQLPGACDCGGLAASGTGGAGAGQGGVSGTAGSGGSGGA